MLVFFFICNEGQIDTDPVADPGFSKRGARLHEFFKIKEFYIKMKLNLAPKGKGASPPPSPPPPT